MLYNLNYIEFPPEAPERSFATVCGEDDALWEADGPRGKLYLRLRAYTPEEYGAIRAQADAWTIREKKSEWYDYDFYANLGGDRTYYTEIGIKDKSVLVKDGAFFGVALRFPEQGAALRYACVSDECGKPLPVYSYEEPKRRDELDEPSVYYDYYLVKRFKE